MTGHLKLMPLLATPSLLLGELQVLGSTNSATVPTVPRGACSPLWGLLANNRVAKKHPGCNGPGACLVGSERRLASAFHLCFLFLKRPSTSHMRGLNLPPIQAAVGEHLRVYLTGC